MVIVSFLINHEERSAAATAANNRMERKIVLVTGASRGIGRAIALTFAQNGYDVIINCLKSADALASLERQILSLGVRCKSFVGDVGSPSFVELMFRSSKRSLAPWMFSSTMQVSPILVY